VFFSKSCPRHRNIPRCNKPKSMIVSFLSHSGTISTHPLHGINECIERLTNALRHIRFRGSTDSN
jgi:hypothetical protein